MMRGHTYLKDIYALVGFETTISAGERSHPRGHWNWLSINLTANEFFCRR